MKRTHDFAAGMIRAASQAGTGILLIANADRKNAINAAMWRAIRRPCTGCAAKARPG